MSDRPSAVGGIVLIAAALAALSFLVVMLSSPAAPVTHERSYWGGRVMPLGPAWTGLPAIPVERATDGSLVGLPTHLSWLAYGDRASAPGIQPAFNGNNTFYYDLEAQRLMYLDSLAGAAPWWRSLLGEPVRVADFPSNGAGAPAVWRSTGAEGTQILRVVVIRVDGSSTPAAFQEEFAADGFVAFTAIDPRNGCTLYYGVTKNPNARHPTDGFRYLFDNCHDSRYDPLDVRRYETAALHYEWP